MNTTTTNTLKTMIWWIVAGLLFLILLIAMVTWRISGLSFAEFTEMSAGKGSSGQEIRHDRPAYVTKRIAINKRWSQEIVFWNYPEMRELIRYGAKVRFSAFDDDVGYSIRYHDVPGKPEYVAPRSQGGYDPDFSRVTDSVSIALDSRSPRSEAEIFITVSPK